MGSRLFPVQGCPIKFGVWPETLKTVLHGTARCVPSLACKHGWSPHKKFSLCILLPILSIVHNSRFWFFYIAERHRYIVNNFQFFFLLYLLFWLTIIFPSTAKNICISTCYNSWKFESWSILFNWQTIYSGGENGLSGYVHHWRAKIDGICFQQWEQSERKRYYLFLISEINIARRTNHNWDGDSIHTLAGS